MEELNCVREEIVVEVLIEVKHEVQTDLPWIHHFLCCHGHFLHVSVLMECLNHCSTVESGHKEVHAACGFPSLLSHDFLCFVADIEDRSCQCLSSLVPESVEDCNGAEVEILDELFVPNKGILWVFEPETGLPHLTSHRVNDVIVVDDSIGILSTVSLFVAVGHEHENSRLSLPKVGQGEGKVVDFVLCSSCVGDFNSAHFVVLWVVSEVEEVEFDLRFVFVPKPGNHGVIVGLLYGEFVGPLIFLGLKLCDWFAALWGICIFVSVISQPQTVVVEGALLHNGEQFRIIEGLNGHLRDVIKAIFVVN